MEEIREVVNAMDPIKASGPDGVPATFYQKYWDIMGVDLTKIVQECFHLMHIPSFFNHTLH